MRRSDPRSLALAGAFTFVFVTLYGGASFLSGFVPWRIAVDFPFEARVPYVSEASYVYLSMNVLLMLAAFVLPWRRMVPAVTALTLQTVLGAICFVLLPVETAFPVRHDASAAFALADFLNLERNFLPSLHVAFAFTGALALTPREGRRRVLAAPLHAWAIAIAASTMLIHEHHLVDVVAGALLAFGTWGYARRHEARLIEAFDVELLCYADFARFARRHRRYAFIALALTLRSLPRWRARRVLRTGFAFLQHVDDLLDGDRATDREPLEVVGEVLAQLRRGVFEDTPLGRLARAFHHDLRRAGGDGAIAKATRLIEVMMRDRARVLAQGVLPETELRAHLRETFALSVDLLLVAGGSELTAEDAPALLDAFAWCSTVRDLEEDLGKGLYLVPAEVVDAAAREGATLDDPSTRHDALMATESARRWSIRERARAVEALDRADQEIAALGGREGVKALAMFARSIRGYADRATPGARQLVATPS